MVWFYQSFMEWHMNKNNAFHFKKMRIDLKHTHKQFSGGILCEQLKWNFDPSEKFSKSIFIMEMLK